MNLNFKKTQISSMDVRLGLLVSITLTRYFSVDADSGGQMEKSPTSAFKPRLDICVKLKATQSL